MLDYGMRREAAEQAHRALQEGQPWDQALVDIAEAELSRTSGKYVRDCERDLAGHESTAPARRLVVKQDPV